jgi:farnesol dehydrogenase
MKIFITGGTGFIGRRLTERLAAEKHQVILLLRDPAKAEGLKSTQIIFMQGDIFDNDVLRKGMQGCDWVFHMAAFTKPWAKDKSLPFKTNVTGTINVIEAAIENNIKKVIITSTGGTIGYSKDGKAVDESTNPDPEYCTAYDKTKAEAEKIAINYSRKNIQIIIVNPTRVYGPGLLSKSNSLTMIIKQYLSGYWRIIPGNADLIGNYVFIDDIVEGHILAARNGRNGERYILGGENLSFREFFSIIGEESGRTRRIFILPVSLIKLFIKLSALLTGITGIPPLITRDWLDKYMNNWIVSSDKAARELGYKITPFRKGIAVTIQWLKT